MRYKSEVVFENDQVLIVNKAPGISTVANRHDLRAPYLLRWLNNKYPVVLPVHRLDHNTSGLVCFAKDKDAQTQLSTAFQNREVVKKYKAIVQGVPSVAEGKIEARIFKAENRNEVFISSKGKNAITHYRVEQSFRGFALLDIDIETGRTHQIRVHLQHIGHPLLVDPMYGGRDSFVLSSIKHRYRGEKDKERPLLMRTPLHAYYLELPVFGQVIKMEVPLPKDMKAVLNQFEKLLG
ncbi:MAG: RluA family pseudouridine synthase [Saprospiraceae bacterium]|nr:RluA family pseudouridine synthase [Saprospiraceae bacterium]